MLPLRALAEERPLLGIASRQYSRNLCLVRRRYLGREHNVEQDVEVAVLQLLVHVVFLFENGHALTFDALYGFGRYYLVDRQQHGLAAQQGNLHGLALDCLLQCDFVDVVKVFVLILVVQPVARGYVVVRRLRVRWDEFQGDEQV